MWIWTATAARKLRLICFMGLVAHRIGTERGGHAEFISRLVSGSRADGGLTRVAISANRLIVDFEDGERRQGDCCSLGFVRMTYRLEGSSFREVDPRTKGSYRINFYPLYLGEAGSVHPSADGNIVFVDSARKQT